MQARSRRRRRRLSCKKKSATSCPCRHYSPTASRQCLIPDIEPVRDKKAANFCDEFTFREIMRQTPESGAETVKKKWEDLFRNL